MLESRALFFTNSVHILSDLRIDHCTGSQPWSKSRRQPTAAPSTFTMKPSMHSSSKPTHPIPSHPSSVPSNLLVPSNIPSTEQISTQAPTIQPKSGNPSLFATSSVAPSITSVQSQEPSSNMTSNSSPSAPPSSSPPPTSTTLYPSGQESLSPTRSLAPSNISSSPSSLPTMVPSSSFVPSEQPIYNSTLTPTTIPTQPPSRQDVATGSRPTRFRIKRRLPKFTLEYEIVPFDAPLESELSELERVSLQRTFASTFWLQ